MSNYFELLIRQDQAARNGYDFDPKTITSKFHAVEPFTDKPTSNSTVQFTNQVVGSRLDAQSVQKSPDTKVVKRYVVMDTSQRDWIKQPNPFSNLTFSFGVQSTTSTNPPVYANNPFVPTFAVEQQALNTPIPGLPNLNGWTLAGSPSNVSYPAYNSSLPNGTFIAYDSGYTINPSGSGFGSIFTPSNVSAIRLVRAVMPQRQFLDLVIVPDSTAVITSAAGTGSNDPVAPNVVTYTTLTTHSFTVGQSVTISGYPTTTFNLSNAVISSVPSTTSFTVSNSADEPLVIYASSTTSNITYTTERAHGFQFGQRVTITGITNSNFNLSNVGIIAIPTANTFVVPAMITATNLSGEAGSVTSSSGTGTVVATNSVSSAVQSVLGGTSFSTFATYPYLMLQLNEYFGQYVGGNEATRRSFSVMTQKQRKQTDFTISVGVQQFDYESWSEEALQLQSPITNLQKLQLTVTDPIGNPFLHSDTLQISLMQTTSDKMYIRCFTPYYQYFSGNEIRVGDRVVFYEPTLQKMLRSTMLALQSVDKTNIIRQFVGGTTFPVLQLLDYVPDVNGFYIPRTAPRTSPYISSFNGFLIPNFTTLLGVEGTVIPTYPGSIDAGTYTVLEPNSLIGANLEFMNASLQPVYTLELDIHQADTGMIGGKIVV